VSDPAVMARHQRVIAAPVDVVWRPARRRGQQLRWM